MRTVSKTFGFLLVSGTIIFFSNLSQGIDWKTALSGALIAKIGTTVAYFLYEVGFEKLWGKAIEAQSETLLS